MQKALHSDSAPRRYRFTRRRYIPLVPVLLPLESSLHRAVANVLHVSIRVCVSLGIMVWAYERLVYPYLA